LLCSPFAHAASIVTGVFERPASGKRLSCHGLECHQANKRAGAKSAKGCCCNRSDQLRRSKCGCHHKHDVATLVIDPARPEPSAESGALPTEAQISAVVIVGNRRLPDPPDCPPPTSVFFSFS
jgi:hypothetical protein